MRFVVCCIITVATQMCIVAALNINCTFQKSDHWPHIYTYYACEVTNTLIITKPNAVITSTTGTHESGKNTFMVEEIHFHDEQSKINFFPKGLENIFPHIKSIRIWNVELKEIHQGDLKPFPDLEVFHPSNNKLEYIEKDLFKYNTKLKVFAPGSCPIAYINPNVFDKLKALTSLFIESCVRVNIINDRTDVVKAIQEIQEKCSDPNIPTEHPVEKNDETTSQDHPTTQMIEINPTLSEVKELKEKYERRVTELLENSMKNEEHAEKLHEKILQLESDLRHQRNTSENRLNEALNMKNVLIFIAFPVVGVITILNIFLIIVCLQKRFNLTIKSNDDIEILEEEQYAEIDETTN